MIIIMIRIKIIKETDQAITLYKEISKLKSRLMIK